MWVRIPPSALMMKLKRVYERPEKADGFRILVDRLWPRGLTRERTKIDLWLKDLSPSDGLRKWFGHDPVKWPEFKRRYFAELKEKNVDKILQRSKRETVTLVYGSKEEKFNNATVLAEYIRKRS